MSTIIYSDVKPNNTHTFFDAVFLMSAAAVLFVLIREGFSAAYVAPVCFCAILYIFARKDLKDRTIPPVWWLVCLPFGILGLLYAPNAVSLAACLTMSVLFFILGYFRVLNGADALSLCCMFCSFAGIGIGIHGFFILPASFILCGVLMAVNKKWRKGAPYLVPLSLCCLLSLLG